MVNIVIIMAIVVIIVVIKIINMVTGSNGRTQHAATVPEKNMIKSHQCNHHNHYDHNGDHRYRQDHQYGRTQRAATVPEELWSSLGSTVS